MADSFAPDIGGIERQVETLVRRQIAQGHDVTVITAVAEQAALDSEIDVVRAAKGRWLTVAFPWRNRRMVAEVLHGRHIDVVHAHFTVISPIAVYVTRAASRRRIPVATTVHSLWWQVALATRVTTLPFGLGSDAGLVVGRQPHRSESRPADSPARATGVGRAQSDRHRLLARRRTRPPGFVR